MFSNSNAVLYWKCKVGETITEPLQVTFTNNALEKALNIAAQLVCTFIRFLRNSEADVFQFQNHLESTV